MKVSVVTLIGLQVLLAAVGLAKSPAENIQAKFRELTSSSDDNDLVKRACNWSDCNSCWSKYAYCIQCSGVNANPSSCVLCLIKCQGECGC
ncbi:hypothetical protein VTO42DRAFT_3805 [Malbranchea cinnamomea]